MKNKLMLVLKSVSVVLGLLLSGLANAGLIIDITDDNGFAKFRFSGSDVIWTKSNFNNGFWVEGTIDEGMMLDAGGSTQSQNAITSGAAGFTVNGSYYSFDDVYANEYISYFDGRIGFRNTVAPLHSNVSAGATISLSGTITSEYAFSKFIEGTYSFGFFGVGRAQNYRNGLTDGLTIRIGSAVPKSISEPSSLATFGLLLLILSWRARRTASK